MLFKRGSFDEHKFLLFIESSFVLIYTFPSHIYTSSILSGFSSQPIAMQKIESTQGIWDISRTRKEKQGNMNLDYMS